MTLLNQLKLNTLLQVIFYIKLTEKETLYDGRRRGLSQRGDSISLETESEISKRKPLQKTDINLGNNERKAWKTIISCFFLAVNNYR